MKATFSRSLGVCVYSPPTGGLQIVHAPNGTLLNPEIDRQMLSLANDWDVMEGETIQDILQATNEAYYLERARSLLQICILMGRDALTGDALLEIERELALRVSSERLTARLLVAPFKDPDSVDALAARSLSAGCAAVGSVLKRAFELQPLLQRLAGYWINLPDHLFSSFHGSRSELWLRLVESGRLPKLLEATSEQAFLNHFGPFVYDEVDLAKRKAIVGISNALAVCLQIGDGAHEDIRVESPEDEEPEPVKPHVAYQRAMRQVEAIIGLVAEGKDQRAKSILDELVETQAVDRGGREYAVKSLCNIAKQCADLFRTDFERLSLEKAVDLDPGDAWTLIQFGDHLKRVGNYTKAESVLEQVADSHSAHSSIAVSALADVYGQRGEFERAIAKYKTIADWQSTPEVRTAIADNLRRQGLFQEAQAAYEQLEAEGLSSTRSKSGKAEIAKNLGDLARAEAAYREVVASETDARSLTIHKLALVRILKQELKLEEAFQIIESTIRTNPFNMHAKALRAAVLGLMDKENFGLAGLPDAGKPRAYGEWLQQYYRGLLLLKLGYYEDAKERLIDNLKSALVTGEERDIQRLAAAVAFLSKNELSKARAILDQIKTVHDHYVSYLWHVLQLHLAVAEQDAGQRDELLRTLDAISINDTILSQAVDALKMGDIRRAQRLEIKALLALAA